MRSLAVLVVNKEDGQNIWPNNDFANSCYEFGGTKKSYS